MATLYAFTKKGREIEFWCSNEEVMNDVEKYIHNCLDAVKWRDRVEETVKPIIISDNEEEE